MWPKHCEDQAKKQIPACRITYKRVYSVVVTNVSIIRLASQKRKRNLEKISRARTVTGFLRQVTSRLVFGRKFPQGVRPVLNKAKLIDHYNENGYGITPKVEVFERHQKSEDTLYFFGNDDPREEFTLVMLDLDVHKAGTPEGAKRLAEHYKKFYPRSYWETSTNGRGQHGYVLLEKEGFTSTAVKQGLKNFENYLRTKATGHDVELVEVKGAPPVVRWAGRQIDDLTYGTFAKLPRGMTLDEAKNLHVLRLDDLLHSPKYQAEPVKVEDLGKIGSVSFDIATHDQMRRLEEFATSCLPTNLVAGRNKVTAHDFAVALAILAWTKDHPNKNGTTPTRRIEALWQVMVEQGVAERSFDCQKWKVIRDELSKLGLIDWRDCGYWFNVGGKGRAMCWEITDEFAELLGRITAESVPANTAVEQGGLLCTDTFEELWIKTLYIGKHCLPKRRYDQDDIPWWDEHVLDRLAA